MSVRVELFIASRLTLQRREAA